MPSGWSKFHDEQKIYCGYFRFVFLVALAAARAIAFRSWEGGESFFEGPNAPIFNLSATILIPTLLLLETIEDEIVTWEWLPVNPVGPGLFKVNAAGDNADPAQLITLEHLPNVADDPWKMEDLQSSGVSCRRTTSCGSLTQEQLMKTPSLTIQQEKHLWLQGPSGPALQSEPFACIAWLTGSALHDDLQLCCHRVQHHFFTCGPLAWCWLHAWSLRGSLGRGQPCLRPHLLGCALAMSLGISRDQLVPICHWPMALIFRVS